MQKLQVQSTLGYGKNYNLGLNAVAPACRPAIRSDNVRDHPAGMSDPPLQNTCKSGLVCITLLSGAIAID